jgi:hypothetical protein
MLTETAPVFVVQSRCAIPNSHAKRGGLLAGARGIDPVFCGRIRPDLTGFGRKWPDFP